MKAALLIAVFFLAGAAYAAPVTIDFEEFTAGQSVGWNSPALQSNGFTIGGYMVDSIYGPEDIYISTGGNGTKVLGGTMETYWVQDGYGASVYVELSRSNGGAFALHDADFFTQTDPQGSSLIVGYVVGGGSVTLNDAALGTGDWLNLQSVTFVATGNTVFAPSSATIELDNVVVSAVPLPAAVWLFASGLGVLGWLRRRC